MNLIVYYKNYFKNKNLANINRKYFYESNLFLFWTYGKVPNSFNIGDKNWLIEEENRRLNIYYWEFFDFSFLSSSQLQEEFLSQKKDFSKKLRMDTRNFITFLYNYYVFFRLSSKHKIYLEFYDISFYLKSVGFFFEKKGYRENFLNQDARVLLIFETNNSLSSLLKTSLNTNSVIDYNFLNFREFYINQKSFFFDTFQYLFFLPRFLFLNFESNKLHSSSTGFLKKILYKYFSKPYNGLKLYFIDFSSFLINFWSDSGISLYIKHHFGHFSDLDLKNLYSERLFIKERLFLSNLYGIDTEVGFLLSDSRYDLQDFLVRYIEEDLYLYIYKQVLLESVLFFNLEYKNLFSFFFYLRGYSSFFFEYFNFLNKFNYYIIEFLASDRQESLVRLPYNLQFLGLDLNFSKVSNFLFTRFHIYESHRSYIYNLLLDYKLLSISSDVLYDLKKNLNYEFPLISSFFLEKMNSLKERGKIRFFMSYYFFLKKYFFFFFFINNKKFLLSSDISYDFYFKEFIIFFDKIYSFVPYDSDFYYYKFFMIKNFLKITKTLKIEEDIDYSSVKLLYGSPLGSHITKRFNSKSLKLDQTFFSKVLTDSSYHSFPDSKSYYNGIFLYLKFLNYLNTYGKIFIKANNSYKK